MEGQKSLSVGREFEKEIFGDMYEGRESSIHKLSRMDLRSSLQLVMQENWARYAEAVETGAAYCHNPVQPEMGKTGLLWVAVNKHLPLRVANREPFPLNLYIAVGSNSLDWHHGIDAFFVWEGVNVTFDVSTAPKKKKTPELVEQPKRILKADFLLTPYDVKGNNLLPWGKRVAKLLLERRRYDK